MPKGTCPKCGAEFHGWALQNPKHQKCNYCGEQLIIVK